MGNCCGSEVQVEDNDSHNVIVKPPSPGEKKSIKQGPIPRKINSTSSSYKLPLPLSFGSRRRDSSDTNGNGNGSGGSICMENTNNNAFLDNSEVPPTGQVTSTPNLRKFKFAELRSVTRNFRPDSMLGEGGFGRVFKGWVDEQTYAPSKVGIGIPVAVKKSSPDSEQGLQEWQAEVAFLGKFSHPNLVKLLGYCWEDRQFLLVYEYMQKGSLENHLFRRGAEPLSWEIRLKIAIGAARGLAFLHNSEKSVIYRDFKAGNILLDEEFNAKLSDFGLAKLGPTNGNSHVTTRVVGTYGYAAPEYIATGHLYIKSDVYGFGVVLLELLTGLRALDPNRPNGSHNLVDWAKPALSDKKKLKKIIDQRLGNRYPLKAACPLAEVSLNCLEGDPKNRPSMEEVLGALERIYLIKEKPKEIKGKGKSSRSIQYNVSSSSQRGISSQRGHENRRSQSHHYHQYGRN